MKHFKIVIFGLLNFIAIYGQNSLVDFAGTFNCTLLYCYPVSNPPADPTLNCSTRSEHLTIGSLKIDSTFTITTKDQVLNCKLKVDNSFNCGFPLGQFYTPDSIWLYIPLGSGFGGGWSYDGNRSVNNQIIEESINEFAIYPNPFDKILNITCKNKLIKRYSLIDLNGKCIINSTELNNICIDLSFLKSGLYLIKLEDLNGNLQYRKVIKK
jgi:hypothetical protein